MKIRRLTKEDAALYKTIRLEMVRLHADAYGKSFTEENNKTVDDYASILENDAVFGLFNKNALIGGSGYFSFTDIKQQHRGFLWGVYIQKEFRGQKMARPLIEHVIDHAKSIRKTHLYTEAATHNAAAIALYKKLGFQEYGQDPAALFVDEKILSTTLLVLPL